MVRFRRVQAKDVAAAKSTSQAGASLSRAARLRLLRQQRKRKRAEMEDSKHSTATSTTGTKSESRSVLAVATNDEVARRRATFVEWKHYFDSHPTKFPSVSQEVIQRANRQGCLFARKIDHSLPTLITVEQWWSLVKDITG